MSNWLIKSASDWLLPLYEEMRTKMLKEDILHADETTVQVLKEPGRASRTNSYMWLYRTGKEASVPIVLFEYQETSGGGYYESAARRWGSFTIRVPKEQYDTFTGSVGGVGHVVSQSGSAEDVGQTYYDIELRLQTQRTKQERLLALLEKAATMEDIISLENALSETEYQIEQYTSDLKRYDSLIDFATIELRLTEVARISDEPGEVAPLGTRVASAFGEGLHSFGDGLGNLAVWLAYHAVGVAAFLAVLAGAGLAVRRRLRKRGAVRAPSDAQTEETEGR